MKKIFCVVFLSVCFCLMQAHAEVKTYQCGDDCTATLGDDGVMRISGTGEMYSYNSTTRFSTPWRDSAGRIRSIVVEDGITNVGSYAFFASGNLENIELAQSVKKVESTAFDEVQHVRNVSMYDTTIWESQDNFNDRVGVAARDVTIHCHGVFSTCEKNFKNNLHNFQSNINVQAKYGKRIYTVQEASAIAGEKNKVKIRYK